MNGKQGLWVPINASIAFIGSAGFESISHGRLNKAVARSNSDSSKAEVKKVLIALKLSVSGGEVMMDRTSVSVAESNAATTW